MQKSTRSMKKKSEKKEFPSPTFEECFRRSHQELAVLCPSTLSHPVEWHSRVKRLELLRRSFLNRHLCPLIPESSSWSCLRQFTFRLRNKKIRGGERDRKLFARAIVEKSFSVTASPEDLPNVTSKKERIFLPSANVGL